MFGAVVSTVQVQLAGVWSTFPACVDRPDFEGVAAVGERRVGLRAGAGGERRRHRGCTGTRRCRSHRCRCRRSRSLRLALLVRPEGPESIEVVGAAVSTVQVELAGVASMLPACVDRPDFEGVAAVGKRRSRLAGSCRRRRSPPSRRHSKLATPEPPVSDAGEAEACVGVVGQARRTGVDRGRRRGGVDGPGESSPGSGRRFRRRRSPGLRRCGTRRRARTGSSVRSKHSNPPPASSRACTGTTPRRSHRCRCRRSKLAEELLVRPEGPESIEVFGAVVSTVQVKAAGV